MSINDVVAYEKPERIFANGLKVAGRGQEDQFKDVFRGRLLENYFIVQYIRPVLNQNQDFLLIDGLDGIVIVVRDESKPAESKYRIGCQLPSKYSGTKAQFVGEVDDHLARYLANRQSIEGDKK